MEGEEQLPLDPLRLDGIGTDKDHEPVAPLQRRARHLARRHPPAFRLRSSTEQAVRLLGLLEQLGAGAQFERSVKVLPRVLQVNRFILAVAKTSIPRDPEGGVLRLCEGLAMPAAGLQLFREHLGEADVVGFGLDEDDMLARVAETHYPGADAGALGIVRDLVGVAARRTAPDRFLYVEVSEAGTPRASFDVNVYAADLRVSDVQDLLARAFRHYAIPDQRFRELYPTMREATFGHLAGGTDRHGREFLTVYFEE